MEGAPAVSRFVGYTCIFMSLCGVTFPPAKVPLPSTIPRKHIERHFDPVYLKEYGELQGYYMKTVRGREFKAFEGIPYAEPPIGHFRFEEPQIKRPWKFTLSATHVGANCIQVDPTRFFSIHGEEDCLYMNIYVPNEVGLMKSYLPVMIWIHGGSYLHGSGSDYGPSYLLDRDIILVTFNYRLGPMGFLSTGDDQIHGNLGLKDQSYAIDWVYKNIKIFGGDRKRITLFGQGSGGAAVHLQMISKRNKGQFARGISQSGTAFNHWTFPSNVSVLTNRLASNLDCKNSKSVRECLEKVPAKTLVWRQYDLYEWMEYPAILFGPVIEHFHPSAFITQTPDMLYETGQVPTDMCWITGVNMDEGNLFGMGIYLSSFGAKKLLKNANFAIPTILMYDKQDLTTTAKVKDFYLGGFAFDLGFSGSPALGNLSRMHGDLFYYSGFHKAIQYHAYYSNCPTYGYFISHRGKHSIAEKFSLPAEWGVAHSDDVQYLFNSSTQFFPMTPFDKDFRITDYMLDLWTSFATFGVPTVSKDELEKGNVVGSTWEPYSMSVLHSKVLEINLDLYKMIPEPYLERVAFWESTPYY